MISNLLREWDARRRGRALDSARRLWSGGGVASAAASALPTNFTGGGLRLRWASASTFVVETGKIRDRTDAYNLSLAAEVTVNLATFAAINGLDRKTGPGTVTNVSTAVTGSGTTFLTDFGPYAGSGTLSTGGAPLTTVTGTGTHFLTELIVGDMIGDGNKFSRVTAIASDTSCTVSTAITLNGGSNYRIIENATLRVNTYTCSRVNFITDNNNLTLETNPGTNGTGVAWYIGDECPDTHLWVHLLYGSSGTGAIASTQRTTPYWAMTNYSTARRGIGSVYNDGSSNLYPFVVSRDGWTYYNKVQATTALRVVSNGTGATSTWARYVASQAIPGRATMIRGAIQRSGGSSMSVFAESVAGVANDASTSRNRYWGMVTDGLGYPFECPCDGVGAFELSQNVGTTAVYLDVLGYYQNLELWK